MGFLRFLLILVIIYYSLKLIGRFVLPWLLKRLIKKMQTQQGGFSYGGFNFGSNFGSTYQQPTAEPEGKVTVQYQSKEKEKGKQTIEGEYVDYEEVKEK